MTLFRVKGRLAEYPYDCVESEPWKRLQYMCMARLNIYYIWFLVLSTCSNSQPSWWFIFSFWKLNWSFFFFLKKTYQHFTSLSTCSRWPKGFLLFLLINIQQQCSYYSPKKHCSYCSTKMILNKYFYVHHYLFNSFHLKQYQTNYIMSCVI